MKGKFWLAAGLVVLASVGCVDRKAQEISKKTAETLGDPIRVVSVKPLSTANLTQTVELTGDVTAGQDTSIGAKVTGRVVAVYVKDGDSVKAGQTLAQLDTTSLLAQLQQADAQVATALASQASAQANLLQTERNASVGPEKTTTGIRQAQAQLRSAQANLMKVLAGARPQERLQAQASLASAKSTLVTQQKELKRIQSLVAEGALAGNRLDQQQNLVDTAQAQFDNAQQAVNLLQVGSRQEDIEAAREAVRSAQEAVRTAQEAKQLDPLLADQVAASQAQVQSAKAQLQTAQAQVAIARQAIEDARIVAPFTGKVLGRPIQAGTIAGNGTTIVRLIGNGGVYFSGQLPSDQMTLVAAGMPAKVTLDALPGRSFDGKVAAVSPQADTVGRLFDVRVAVNGGSDVRPGMFASAKIQVRTIHDAPVVPDQAILHDGDQAYIFVIHGDRADRIPVTTGLQQGTYTQVTGVPTGSSVVIAGHETLAPGAKIKIQDSAKQAMKGSALKEG